MNKKQEKKSSDSESESTEVKQETESSQELLDEAKDYEKLNDVYLRLAAEFENYKKKRRQSGNVSAFIGDNGIHTFSTRYQKNTSAIRKACNWKQAIWWRATIHSFKGKCGRCYADYFCTSNYVCSKFNR